ncbi:hypothetical protein SCATT_p07730 (plasmid) [Streptantibioticus cattleyicolor NRRL 8057 = DSM 46488]|uniref:Uncharacterized protein n=1 Tax=Streptantibioticus cattleyicolor (strain ATCC 35852 / DSM 46488 / JCM 4925 / NBRC 14057 / NRRL 8057) TaxID=1003195 RepID=G8XHU9_STREN|nr:hypothetical protein SCATT_p07730 [Streptantibioticus cattleyicolor NRRL 8057 = DSM 46488]
MNPRPTRTEGTRCSPCPPATVPAARPSNRPIPPESSTAPPLPPDVRTTPEWRAARSTARSASPSRR